MDNGKGRHPFNVGVVRETTSIEIVLTKMTRRELSTMFSKLKQLRTWVEVYQGFMQPWTTSKLSFNHT